MVLLCQHLLPEANREIYLQGAASFTPLPEHASIKVYCSSHNPGAKELVDELNVVWAHLLEVVDDVDASDHMLLYLNAATWAHNPERLAAEIRQAQRLGVHVQPCHEFPSAIDPVPGGDRAAISFKLIMNSTPTQIKSGRTNVYTESVIPLKSGQLREVGFAMLAQRLTTHVPRAPIPDEPANRRSSRKSFIINALNRRSPTTGFALPAASQSAPLDVVDAVGTDAPGAAGAIPVSAESSV